uniref:Uncharacterized protein n=1 Tax=Opuntia streptacantha TaxID=393608 RepID=A0A7C9EQ46_OPUST
MVEEMHALERKTQCAKVPDALQITSALADQQISVHSQSSQREFQICSATGQDSRCKHSRIEALPGVEQSKEQFGISCYPLPNSQAAHVGGSQTGELVSHSSALRSSQETTTCALPADITRPLAWSPLPSPYQKKKKRNSYLIVLVCAWANCTILAGKTVTLVGGLVRQKYLGDF